MTTKRKYYRTKGGSLRRTTRTIKPTIVEQPVELTREQLSGKIQWLIDFAGTDKVMESVASNFTTQKPDRIIVNGELDPSANYKNKIIFNTRTGDVGHWIYFNDAGEEFNSYKLGHQKPATNQFCQSFATLYMLHNYGKKNVPKFYDQLQATTPSMRLSERHQRWGHNIEVIVDMWKWILNKWSKKAWVIKEFRNINDEYIDINSKTKIKNKKMTPINDVTSDISFDLITSKLNDIVAHKVEIAEKT